jgi:endonuclease YncB( thermonuclease family)
MRYTAALIIAILLAATTGAAAEDRLTGPVAAELVRVVDGDTLAVKAHIWLGQTIETKVRIRGIDTPETKGKCAREVSMAAAATARLEEIAGPGLVILTNVEPDKYGGRAIADIAAGDADLAALMLRSGLARAYDGGRRGSWCDIADAK